MATQFKFWHYGLLVTLALSALLGYNLLLGDKSLYLAGAASHGHHQIELACDSCHGGAFGGPDALQQACESCHLDALNKTKDTHPKTKFTDPRNADLLAHLDATQCVTCHREHKPEITRAYGVTLAPDFCQHCHAEIAEERPNHKDFGFDSCTSAGCHNYHDNSALYENFLRKHVKEQPLLRKTGLPALTGLDQWLKKHRNTTPLKAENRDADDTSTGQTLSARWADSHHAQAQVNCSDCHQQNQQPVSGLALSTGSCQQCHDRQWQGFTEGKHGMRLSPSLQQTMSPMSPALARQPMHNDAHSRQLSCVSCHDPHQPGLRQAAVDACLGCHQDPHSLAFPDSPHGQLWQAAEAGTLAENQAVSCASCHLPRIKKGRAVFVDHNQNNNLQPNSKMLRSVCGQCHGLEFAMAALADPALILNNFTGAPQTGHQSMDMVRERLEQRRQSRQDHAAPQNYVAPQSNATPQDNAAPPQEPPPQDNKEQSP